MESEFGCTWKCLFSLENILLLGSGSGSKNPHLVTTWWMVDGVFFPKAQASGFTWQVLEGQDPRRS